MSKVIVTGASGFLGKNLCNYITDHELIRVYNNTKIENGWICDLTNKESVKMLIERSDPDIIVHCAADPSPKHPEDYEQFIKNHILTTVNLLENCKKNTKFIYISSVLVFGNNFPIMEPTNLYGACKSSCETICDVYGKLKNLKINIIRPCAIVGQRLTHGLLFDIQRKLRSDSLTLNLWGNEPGSIKPFVHVLDVCEWIKKCIEEDITLPINAFPTDSISVKDIAQITMNALNIHKEIVWESDKVWIGDNSLIDTSKQSYLCINQTSTQAIERMLNETPSLE